MSIWQHNFFVDFILPHSIIRRLSKKEMAEYRRPFLNAGEDRRPTLTFPREIPVGGVPPDVHNIITSYNVRVCVCVSVVRQTVILKGRFQQWLAQSSHIPKLWINAEPGGIIKGELREMVRSWPNLTETTVKGRHFMQEDSPHEIGAAVQHWYTKIVEPSQ